MPRLSSIRKRARKALAILAGSQAGEVGLHAWPWDEPGIPYHTENPIENEDGHGGYTHHCLFDAQGFPYKRTLTGPTYGAMRNVYHPLVIARYALKMLAVAHATGDTAAMRRAEAMLPALVRSGEATGAWGPGRGPYEMAATLPHANVQGVVISTLLRLCGGEPDARLRAVLERATARLLAPIAEGGTRAILNDAPFLEEFPRAEPSHQLGGCISGLFGLYDLADTLGHEAASEAANAIQAGLSQNAALFSTGSDWSLYALNVGGLRYLASMSYHWSHICRIRVVGMRTLDDRMVALAQRWEEAAQNTWTRVRVTASKSAQTIWARHVRQLPLHEG